MKSICATIAIMSLFAGVTRLQAQGSGARYQHNTAPYSYEAPSRYSNTRYGEPQTTSRSTAVQVQKALARKGFYYGAADGVLGSQSREAIRQYQASVGLRQTGMVDDRLLKSLHINSSTGVPDSYGTGTPVYGRGKSVAVEVQSALSRKGFYRGSIDGVLGSQSRESIRQYQISRGLRGTGTVDEGLLRSLGLL